MSPPTSLVQPVIPKQQHFPSSLSPISTILIFDLSRCGHSHHRLPQPHNVLLDLLPQRHNPHSRESFALSLFSLIFEFFSTLLACSVAGVRVFLPQPACSSEKAATHPQSSHCQCATPTFSVLMAICCLN